MRPDAFRLAIDLLHFPAKARSLRARPLPDDVFDLIRVACGEKQAVAEASAATGRSQKLLRDAAEFFVEQVLLYPDSDAYRVLGAQPDATYHDLRRNMAVLLRWVHPDGEVRGERAVFASRVTQAWDNLKTENRRAAYDRERRAWQDPRRGLQQGRPDRPFKPTKRKRGAIRAERRPLSAPRRQFVRPVQMHRDSSLLRRFLMLFFGRTTP